MIKHEFLFHVYVGSSSTKVKMREAQGQKTHLKNNYFDVFIFSIISYKLDVSAGKRFVDQNDRLVINLTEQVYEKCRS